VADPNDAYTNPTLTMSMLGAPDDVGCSLGRGGYAVLDLGPDSELFDTAGADVLIQESSEDAVVDGYRLYGGNSYLGPWTLIGESDGTAAFDLATSLMARARYLRIEDDGDGSANDPYAGFDLDGVVVLGDVVGMGTAGSRPWTRPVLRPPTPNPAPAGRPVRLGFEVGATIDFRLELFDVTGRHVKTLAGGESSIHPVVVSWDGSNSDGTAVSPGTYFVQLIAGERSTSRKLVLVR
jgi:hypothetical protein